MKALEIDKKFDDNKEDILEYFDISKAKMLNQGIKKININFPVWMVEKLDKRAKYLGVNRQALIKLWLAEKLEAI